MSHFLLALVASLVLTQSWACAQTPASAKTDYLPAFPGAQGAGAKTTGGRGGRVLAVINLNDAGEGSLRAAIEAEGPRTIVFRVAGTIELQKRLVVKNGDLTIAGQSAPGGGVCLRNQSFLIEASNVIVRHLRSRLGDKGGGEGDCITIWKGASNVILDHCSATWSEDEALSLGGNAANVTIQWCLIAEALRLSKHTKGAHAYGSLMRANGPVSLHHNLWAHNDSRNPRLGDNYGQASFPTFDVRNNVIYDYGSTASGQTQGNFGVNYVGNYIKSGPSSRAKTPITVGGPSQIRLFLSGNEWENHDDFTRDNSKFPSSLEVNGKPAIELLQVPVEMPNVPTSTARAAYEAVLNGAGATQPRRDAVDARIVKETREGSGKLIDSQSEVGGWPELESAPAPTDSDGDGMPDAWERANGFKIDDTADSAKDADADGYTNLEEYLNATEPRVLVNYKEPKNNVDTLSSLDMQKDIIYSQIEGEDLAPYAQAVRKLAGEKNVPLVDLHANSSAQLEAIGSKAADAYNYQAPDADPTKPDRTHLSPAGAAATAQLVTDGLQNVIPELKPYFVTNITVAADGSGDYKTVQDAVDAVPNNAATRFTILIKPGVYKAHLVIPKSKTNITLLGADAQTTILTNDLHVKSPGQDGKEVGTIGSASSVISADDFRAENLTFENNAPHVAQALAIYVQGDRAEFHKCRFLGYQDTIRVRKGRHYFEDCLVTGRTDFIYGEATAWFERCQIHVTETGGWITAANTPQEQPYGLIFSNCLITGEPNVQEMLGRPWRPYAHTVWLNTRMSDAVNPLGWNNWSQPDNEKTARYEEYNSQTLDGKPLDISRRVAWAKQLSAEEAAQYTLDKVLGDWDPIVRPAIVLAGDSTMTDTAGWGGAFATGHSSD